MVVVGWLNGMGAEVYLAVGPSNVLSSGCYDYDIQQCAEMRELGDWRKDKDRPQSSLVLMSGNGDNFTEFGGQYKGPMAEGVGVSRLVGQQGEKRSSAKGGKGEGWGFIVTGMAASVVNRQEKSVNSKRQLTLTVGAAEPGTQHAWMVIV